MLNVTYAECHLWSVSLKLNFTYNPFMLSVIMLNVIMLSVIMLSVAAPFFELGSNIYMS